jgi:hypothetical protein
VNVESYPRNFSPDEQLTEPLLGMNIFAFCICCLQKMKKLLMGRVYFSNKPLTMVNNGSGYNKPVTPVTKFSKFFIFASVIR